MTPDQIKAAVKEALEDFSVPPEQHYQDHLWVKNIREWSNDFKSSFFRSIAKYIAITLLGFLFLGFVFWGQHHFK